MWKSTLDDRVLTFRLVGLNNQNFIMEDEQTGTWWQQVTGEAIAGPLKGRQLEQVFFEQVTWEQWNTEYPQSTVLESRSEFAERYFSGMQFDIVRDGETMMPFPMEAKPDDELEQGEMVVALRLEDGREKAYPLKLLREQNPITDRFGGKDLLLVIASDDSSVRAFDRSVDGRTLDFYRVVDEDNTEDDEEAKGPPVRLVDAETQSVWDFRGVAVSGPLAGTKLERVQVYTDYWFDWSHFNPDGLVYAGGVR